MSLAIITQNGNICYSHKFQTLMNRLRPNWFKSVRWGPSYEQFKSVKIKKHPVYYFEVLTYVCIRALVVNQIVMFSTPLKFLKVSLLPYIFKFIKRKSIFYSFYHLIYHRCNKVMFEYLNFFSMSYTHSVSGK